MFKSFGKLYLILFIILVVLIVTIGLLSKRQLGKNNVMVTPTLPESTVKKAFTTPPPLIHPTSTGGNEQIATATANFALEKQVLRKLTPLSQNGFTITFDYANDRFIVTLAEPKDNNKNVFLNWLKQNYPLLTLDEFIFK